MQFARIEIGTSLVSFIILTILAIGHMTSLITIGRMIERGHGKMIKRLILGSASVVLVSGCVGVIGYFLWILLFVKG